MGVYVSKVKEAEANLHLVGGGRERAASPGGLKTRDVCKIGERVLNSAYLWLACWACM